MYCRESNSVRYCSPPQEGGPGPEELAAGIESGLASGIQSSLPSGIETPDTDFIQLRKESGGGAGAAPRQLYTVRAMGVDSFGNPPGNVP